MARTRKVPKKYLSAAEAAPVANPYPCPAANLDTSKVIPCGGHLVPQDARGKAIDLDKDGASRWACSVGCGFVVDAEVTDHDGHSARCPADGAPLRFDGAIVGLTCGGLRLRGWNVCDHCGGVWVTRRGRPDAGGGADGRWRLSSGGRSLDAGNHRLRVDGKKAKRGADGEREDGDEIVTLMARISRMPAFEEALSKIAAGDLDRVAMADLAREVLAIGDGVDEIEADPSHDRKGRK